MCFILRQPNFYCDIGTFPFLIRVLEPPKRGDRRIQLTIWFKIYDQTFLFVCLCKCTNPALSTVPVSRHILHSLRDPRRNIHDQSKGALRQIIRGRQEQRGTFPSNPTVCLCQKLDVLTEEMAYLSTMLQLLSELDRTMTHYYLLQDDI